MPEDLKGKLSLSGFQPEQDTQPSAAIFAVDRQGEVIHRVQVAEDGSFELPARILKKSDRILVGPDVEDLRSIERDRLSVFRTEHARRLVAETGTLSIARQRWHSWFGVTRCADGSVRHCFPYPWLIRDLVAQTVALPEVQARRLTSAPRASLTEGGRLAQVATLALPYLPYRCRPVCEGLVEVYRRVCCCRPWVVYDPRFDALLERLEELVPLPPRPPLPDPPPFEELPFLRGGAIDPIALNARRDLDTLKRLSPQERLAYVQQRPYLHCFRSCFPATQVGQGFIQPDGTFNVCWKEPLILLLPGCRFEYAFVVKQVVNGQEVTIYDGPGANQWFDDPEGVLLTSYHPKAVDCDDSDLDDDGTRFAVLERIGDTDSYNLDSPLPTSPTSVGAPGVNGGLAFPVPGPATGLLQNRNWGGTLPLYFFFSESLAGVATRYRVSVAPANPDGTAAAAPVPLADPVTWLRYEIPAPATITTVAVPLGPDANGTFQIPYFALGPWVGGRYHAYLDTTGFTQGRYLVILELFDNAGNLVTPTGSGNQFTFRRWVAQNAPLVAVTEDAMPHIFWWDNRVSVAEIEGVQGGSNAGTPQCLFLEGSGATPIRVSYRAYHPEERFQLRHNLYWWRGLGGGLQSWPVPAPSANVGQPPMAPGLSDPRTIDQLLGPESACSFGLRLRTHVKTFNGSGTLDGLEGEDQAAFALSKT